MSEIKFSDPNQPQRFANQKKTNDKRALDIESVYDGEKLSGKVVLVTGANRGLGEAIAKELISQKAKVIATCRSSKPKYEGLHKVIDGIDVTDKKAMDKLVKDLEGQEIDILINNAGYFMVEKETIENPNFDEEVKMIDICAVGQIRVTSALFNAKLLKKGSKVVQITSQGGSIAWRTTQNAGGPFDYGHHMSKAAANMAGKLLAIELAPHGILVQIMHPGFNKTDMTKKYEKIWEVEGAVDASVGAKRVCHEINLISPERYGLFINCEDGLQIPW
mmetsp:Transcript_2075/g.3141  ORF Transcript_2075/g.3141 Transcript_2075/m.3141 type:complete len:276 (-) Transcript_2075:252-1079(-)|eukprot:jgi/Bigna1/56258/estExt_Genewise1Plus.C_890057